jgi:hypothetical protein
MAPYRYAHKDNHVNDRRETHGKGCQEQALMWMAKDSGEDFGIESVAQAGYDGEEDEEADVEDEEDDGYDLEPAAVVRELVEYNGQDASTHGDYEPSVVNRLLGQRLTVSRALTA